MPEQSPTAQKLTAPLDVDTLFALRSGGFILYGIVTLASGTKTVSDPRIQTGSVALVSYVTNSSPGTLRAACTQGTLTITSSSGTDASKVAYLIVL